MIHKLHSRSYTTGETDVRQTLEQWPADAALRYAKTVRQVVLNVRTSNVQLEMYYVALSSNTNDKIHTFLTKFCLALANALPGLGQLEQRAAMTAANAGRVRDV